MTLRDPVVMLIVIIAAAFALLTTFMAVWMRERRHDRAIREQELQDARDRESEYALAEQKRLEQQSRREEELRSQSAAAYHEQAGFMAQILERERAERREAEQRRAMDSAGAGSGGYIIIELSEKERPLFHDLLKGFEDYAKLKGYDLSFSIDSSFEGRIAFKFTVKNDGVVVGPERVRRDFREYLERVRNDNIEDLDNLPVIASLEEHNLLITLLKNRITLLKHSYQLSQNAVRFYEGLLNNIRTFPALPGPSVIVQTGGNMDSRNYNATNSSRLIQGETNAFTDSSTNIQIGDSFNEKQARVAQLDDVLERLSDAKADNNAAEKLARELGKVKDELTQYSEPNRSAVQGWLERAKQLLATAALGAEVTDSAHKLFQFFGI